MQPKRAVNSLCFHRVQEQELRLSWGLGSSAGYKFSVVRSRRLVADVDDSCEAPDCNYFSSDSSLTKSRKYQRMNEDRLALFI